MLCRNNSQTLSSGKLNGRKTQARTTQNKPGRSKQAAGKQKAKHPLAVLKGKATAESDDDSLLDSDQGFSSDDDLLADELLDGSDEEVYEY
jgi:hypothetical protein